MYISISGELFGSMYLIYGYGYSCFEIPYDLYSWLTTYGRH